MSDKAKVEALGYQWIFSANSVMADVQRSQLIFEARSFIEKLPKRSERMTAFAFFSAYADTVSALENIEGETEALGKGEDLADSLFDPAEWLKLAQYAYDQNQYAVLEQLAKAAQSCNPQWQTEDNPVEGAPADAKATLDQAEKSLEPENNPDAGEPDTEAIQEATERIVSHAEAQAKEAGKIGPQTFRRPRKK